MARVTDSPRLTHSSALAGSCATAWGSLLRFGLGVVLLSLAVSLLLTPWLSLPWWKVFRRCVSLSAALTLWYVLRREGRSLRSLGFGDWGAGKRHLLMGLCLGCVGLAVLLVAGLLSGACQLDVAPDRVKLWRTLIGFLPTAALVGVFEELIFRGFLLQRLLACSTWVAVVTSSALYAAVHLRTWSLGPLVWLELGGLFLVGGLLATSYLLTQQLYLAVGLHASLAYGARVNKLLIGFTDSSHAWLVGTSRLVNGLASWIALIGMGLIMVWWVRTSQNREVKHGHP